MTVAIICVALLSLLVFVLGIVVSANRGRTEKIAGFPDDATDPLYKAVRAHGNTIEYVPILAILMLYLGSQSPERWIIGTMIAVTVARYLIVAGLLLPADMNKPNPMRFTGALVTYIGGLTLVVATFLTVL